MTRTRRPTRPVAARPGSFVLHPLSLAALLALAGPAFALPQGATVVNGQVTLQAPTATLQVVTQGSQKAIVDWASFSIAAGERVRFDQPSSSAVILNRVTGVDPSAIFGQMQANGRVFLLNPYGVVFGATARVDVGGLLASSLSLSNADFLAGRLSLSSADPQAPAQRGAVRNEGLISAPGGVVVLAGPSVANSGTIDAAGGRVGMAAVQEVLVDVEGDGLIFFQARASEAGNRLAQLGRIHADGGTVELRAAARGSFADTVLNMSGVVQARGLGERGGQVVIDGGAEGRTRVSGQIDASGTTQGGDVSVTGQLVALADSAYIDVSGSAGGGTIRVGGGYQGQEAQLRNSEVTAVGSGARLNADATVNGDGGTVVVWSDGRTLFAGEATARGGAQGGNGGLIETSGKLELTVLGRVDARAPKGRMGTWLLDPLNIDVVANGSDDNAVDPGNVDEFTDDTYGTPGFPGPPAPQTAGTSSIAAGKLTGAIVVLQATNDITFSAPLTLDPTTALTARAGHDINVNNTIDAVAVTGAAITLSANDPSPGSGRVGTGRVLIGAAINAGNLPGTSISITNNGSSVANRIGANLNAGNITVDGATILTGSTTLTVQTLARFTGALDGNTAGGESLTVSAGAAQFDAAVGATTRLNAISAGSTQIGAASVTANSQAYSGTVTLAGSTTLTGNTIALNGAGTSLAAGANSVAIQTGNLTLAAAVTSDGSGATRLAGAAAGDTVGLEFAGQTATFTQAELTALAPFGSITIGRSDGTGAISAGAITLPKDTSFSGLSAPVNFTDAITGGTHALATSTTGLTTLAAAATSAGLTSLNIAGPSSIAAPSVNTSGTQTYTGNVTLAADTTLNAGAVEFGGTLNGAQALAVNAAGTTRFAGTVGNSGGGLASLSVAGAAQVDGGSIRTSGAQDYNGSVTLGADAVFTGSAIAFDNATTALAAGTRSIAVQTNALTVAGPVTSSGAGTARLAAAGAADTVGVETGGQTASFSQAQLNAFDDFATLTIGRADGTGAITAGAITLPIATSFIGQNATVNFNGALAGNGQALTTNTTGLTTFGAASAPAGLSSLNVLNGPTQLDTAGITTSGAQTYGGTLTLGTDTTLTGSAINLNGAGTSLAAGANDITLRTRSLSVTAAVTSTGAGTAQLAGLADADTIGVASAATTDVTIPQSALDGFAGFDALIIGSATGTGTITVGAVTLPTDLTLRGDTAAVNFTGAIAGGGHALASSTGGVTTLAAAATTTNLGSLAITGTGAATLNGNVSTLGTQTYTGTVTLGAASTFSGTTVSFNAAGTALAAGANNVAIETRDLTLGGAVTSTGAGTARLGAFAAGDTLGIATAAVTTAAFTQAELDAFSTFSALTLGRSNGAGTVTLGAASLPLATTVIGLNAAIDFGAAITGNNHALSTGTAGLTTLGAAATLTNVASLAIAGPAQVNGTVSTSGAQTYSNTLTLGADSTLNGSSIDFDGAIAGGAHALTVNGSGLTTIGAGAAGLASLAVNAAAAIDGGTIASTGAQTYSGTLTLGASSTVNAGSASFVGAVNANTNGGQGLTVNSAGLTSFGSTIGATNALSSLTTDAGGSTSLAGNVQTTGTQTYNDGVTLNSATTTITAGAAGFNGTLDAAASGAQALVVNAGGATVFGATVGGTQPLASLSTNAGGTVSLQNASTTGAITLGENATLNGTLSSNGFSAGGTTTLAGGTTTINAGAGNVSFAGAVNGTTAATQSLAVNSTGSTSFGGPVGTSAALLSLSTNAGGSTTLAGNVFTGGAQSYGDNLALTATTTLDASTMAFGANLDVGAFDLILQYDTVFSGPVSVTAGSTGFVSLAPRSAGASIDVAGSGVGTFQVPQATLDGLTALGNIGVGRPDGTGLISVGALTLPANFKLQSGSGNVQFVGVVTGAGIGLTISTDGNTAVTTAMTGLSTLSVGGTSATTAGTTTLSSGSITTTGAQTYSNAVTLGAANTLAGSSVSFGNTVNGTQNLTVNSAGATVFGAAVGGLTPLNALSTDAAGTLTLGGNVSTVGAQTYAEAVTLSAANSTLTAPSVSFNASVNGSVAGANALTVNAGGLTVFTAAVGAGAALASLTTDAAGSTQLGANITTTGAQAFNDAVTLSGNVVLAAGSVGFGSSVNGAQSLTVNTAGSTSFGAAVGALTPLASLSTDAGGSTVLSGFVGTSGAQSYGDAVRLASSTTLNGASIAFAGAVDATTAGAQGLLVNAGGVTSFGAGAGSGTALAFLSTDAGGSTSLAGNVTTSGTQFFGDAVTLGGNALLSASALTFASSLDGGHNLTLNSAGLTRFGAAVGGSVALASLSTDAAGTLQIGANVTTSAAQTYNEALTLTGNAVLSGSSLGLLGTVNGAFALTVNAAGTTTFGANVGTLTPLASLTTDAGGTTVLPAVVTTSGAQTYGDSATLSANTTLNASAASLGGLAAGNFNLSTRTDALSLGSTASGSGALDFAPTSAAGTIGIGGGTGTLQLDTALLSRLDSFGSLTIGRADGTGAITVGTATLPTDTTLVGTSAPVNFTGTLSGGGNALAVTSGDTTTVTGSLIGLGSLTITNATQLGGATITSIITSTGAQTYGSAVTLGGDAGLVGSNLLFNAGVNGPHTLSLVATGTTTFAAPVGDTAALAGLVTSGSTQVNGGAVTTTGAQGYGAVTVGADTSFTSGSVVNFIGTLDGAHAVTVTSPGNTRFAGAVGAGTALTSLSVANATDLDAGTVRTTGAQSYGGAVTLGADTTLTAGGVDFAGSVNGARALTVNATGLTRFGGAVGNTATLGSVSISGAAQLDGASVATSGAQTYGSAVTLGVNTNLDTGSATFTGTVNGPGALVLNSAGAASFGGDIGGSGALAALAVTAGGPIQLGGSVTTSGTQSWTGALTLAGDTSLTAAGPVTFTGSIDSAAGAARDLSITGAAGGTTFRGAVGATRALGDLVVNGAADLGGTVATTGDQTYNGAVRIGSASTLGGANVHFTAAVDGPGALTVNAANTDFDAAVGATTALASLSTDAAGTTRLAGNVSTTGNQTYGDAILLTGPSTLTGSTITFGGAVNGAQALTVIGSGSTAVFNAAVGNLTPLASLNVSGPALLNGGSITTSGSQTFVNAVTLGSDNTLTADSIGIGGALDGAHALTLQSAGLTQFGAAVGSNTALASLTAAGGGAVSLLGNSIDTSGAQSYSGNLQLAGSTQLRGASLNVGGNIAGAQDLTLDTDTLSIAGTTGGTGTLSITPLTANRSIGVAGGAGDLQVSQALLDGAAGFAAHRIGRADGSGDINAGALQLRANTTLQTGSGSLRLNGSVDGGFDLALNSGAVTHIAGPVGTTSALRSLTTDNNSSAADWNGSSGEHTAFDLADGTGRARVITTGAQTFNDPVLASVPLLFNGSAISAEQAASRFAGAVSANATSLQLRSNAGIMLGDVTLTGGGRIEADGLLQVAGALALNGGTLSLVSNATPTSIAFTDPELQGRTLNFGLAPVTEASATVFQTAGSTISSAAGSLLVLRSPNGGSLRFENTGNNLLGGISAVSGPLGDTSTTRFTALPLGFVRISSTEINAVGAPPTDGSQTLLQAGIEGDVLKLSADRLTTGATGLLRARLPFDNSQGSTSSVPGMTLIMSPTALTIGGGFGLATPDGYIQVRVGSQIGGFLTVRPRGVSGDNAFILLAGPDPKPFYDGTGKLTEVRVFYNGDAPRTPQESGALTAVTAIVEDARQTRFEEAVRTENVKSRLRSGVIAEVGAGRPATVGRESIRLPQNCNPKTGTLQCE